MLGALRRGGGQGPTGPARLPTQGFYAGETDPERSCGLPQVTQRGGGGGGGGQGSTLACLSRVYPPPGVLMQGGLPVLPTMLHGVLGEAPLWASVSLSMHSGLLYLRGSRLLAQQNLPVSLVVFMGPSDLGEWVSSGRRTRPRRQQVPGAFLGEKEGGFEGLHSSTRVRRDH